ncbi:MAG: ferritin [Synergistaceae bacterium]|nr:ferritin [Synergistaceae bacterium]
MLRESVFKALNDQVNAEYFSAYLYMGMAAYAENAGFKGTAHWLLNQAKEEAAHGARIFEYILERGSLPILSDIAASPANYGSIREVFAKVVSHEKHVTDLINDIADLAVKERDHASYRFILWYVEEQVEEVSSAEDILNKVTAAGDSAALLYGVDALLGQRKFKHPFE